MDEIQHLCKEFTDLNDNDIEIIKLMAKCLPEIADLEEADIFIDCPTKDGEAIVVAEAKPSDVESSYLKSVVGMLAKELDEPAVARSLRLGLATRQMKARTQEGKFVIQSVQPIISEGKVIGVLIREQKTENTNKDSRLYQHYFDNYFTTVIMEEPNSWLMEYIDEGLIIVNSKGIVEFRNKIAMEIYKNLGYIDDILGQKYQNISIVEVKNEKQLRSLSVVEIQVGDHFFNVRHVYLGEEHMEYAVILRDITWKRKQEKELILKSVAIKEMHHRVKNNLQTIASLLRLQSRRTKNTETRQDLNDSMNRVLSIAGTHELLAKNVDEKIKIQDVIKNVKKNAIHFLGNTLKLEMKIEGDDFFIDSDIATTMALIINELVQNSLKYAFKEREKGTISIIINRGILYSSIKVGDDGCGFDVQSLRKGSLGLNIVESLVKDKLHGTLIISSGEMGTNAVVEFSNKILELVNTPEYL